MSNKLVKIIDGIKDIFPEVADVEITADTPLGEIPEWDSIAAVNLQSFLKETFGVEVPLVLMNEDRTIEEVAGFVEDPASMKRSV